MKILIYGMIVGATMLIPGVSGGTMAMILGIYDQLIYKLQKLSKDNIIYLSLFILGGLLGILLFSKSILTIYDRFNYDVIYFFIGTIIASALILFKELKIKKINIQHLFYIGIGMIFVLLFNQLPIMSLNNHFIILILCGLLLSIALILPGISVSYVLLILGLYDQVMNAIVSLNIMILLPIILGVIIGIIITSKLLNYYLNHYQIQTYMIILGFVLASIFMIIPGIPHLSSIVLLIVGFYLLYCINKMFM